MTLLRKRSDSFSTTVGKKKRLPANLGLILEFTDGDEMGREVALLFERTVLGRKAADILVRDIAVSASHAAIEYRAGSLLLTDLGSSNGTFVDGVRVQKREVQVGQEVRVGECAFRLKLDPARAAKLAAGQSSRSTDFKSGLSELIEREFTRAGEPSDRSASQARHQERAKQKIRFRVLTGPDHGKEFAFSRPSVIIGRMNADLPLQDRDVSRKHAILEQGEGGQVILRDLASVNGTQVNQRRVTNCVLATGDRIQVGKSTIIFLGAEKG